MKQINDITYKKLQKIAEAEDLSIDELIDKIAKKKLTLCFYCDNLAICYCDGIIDRKPNTLVTCDRPLCQDCILNSSSVFYKFTHGTEVDSNDYCKRCYRLP